MVAPAPGAEPRKKWRHHCSTCGGKFTEPRSWAYCSKACERARRGNDRSDSEGGIDEWLHPLFEERMRLKDELRTAMPWERVELEKALAANQAKEDTVRAELANLAPARDSVAFWAPLLRTEADRFEASLRRSLAIAVKLGRRLIEAREALRPKHGEFGRLFRDHESPVEGALPFSARWGQMLMAIAANAVIVEQAKANHDSHLPTDLNTVYLLSRVPEPELEAAIERGDVTPEMKRGDARDLLPPADDVDEPAQPIDQVARALDPIQRALRRFAAEHASEFGDLKARLKSVLRGIERELAPSEASAGTELMRSPDRGDIAS